MKSKLLVSTAVLILAAFSVGGSTVAWFTAQADPLTSTFSAGTVEISVPDYLGLEEDGEDYTVSWRIENTGTKSSYIRAKLLFEWDAEASDVEFNDVSTPGEDITFGNVTRTYFTYTKNDPNDSDAPYYTENNPFTVPLVYDEEGEDIALGQVSLWDDGTLLYAKLETFGFAQFFNYPGDDYASALFVGTTGQSNPGEGLFLFNQHDHSGVGEEYVYTYEIDEVRINWTGDPRFGDFEDVDPGATLYMFVNSHMASLQDVTEPVLEDSFGDEWIKGSDGWWYYGTAAGPTAVEPGADIEVGFLFSVGTGVQAQISLQLQSEAVQSSHNAIDFVWPDSPWTD